MGTITLKIVTIKRNDKTKCAGDLFLRGRLGENHKKEYNAKKKKETCTICKSEVQKPFDFVKHC